MRRSPSGERIRRQWGRLLSVSEEEVSRRVLVAQAAGENTLTVDNGYIFGDKGWVQVGDQVGDQVTQHTGWDEDTQILTLVDDLAVDVEEGDRIGLWSHSRTALVVELTAQVDRDGVRGVPLECDVDESLLDSLPVGPRDVGEGEDVLVEYDPEQDSWTVIRTSGQARIRGLKHEPHDSHVLTSDEVADGSFTHTLVHSLIVEDRALLCLVNGVAYSPAALDIDAENGTVTVTLGGWETADNAEIWFDYWYRRGALVAPADPDPAPRQWHIEQIITAYEQHGVWTDSGPYVGMSVDEAAYAGLTLYDSDRVWFDWRIPDEWTLPDWAFDTLGIVEVYIEGEFDGNGTVGFVEDINNPGYPSAAEWPDGTDSGSHITLDSYWGDESLPGCIHVDGPTTWTHSFALDATASDPYYEGNNYDDVTHKLEVSLRSRTDDLNWVNGQLQLQGAGAVIQPTTFKLWIVGT